MVVENNKLPRVSANLSMDRPPIYEGKSWSKFSDGRSNRKKPKPSAKMILIKK